LNSIILQYKNCLFISVNETFRIYMNKDFQIISIQYIFDVPS